MAAIDAVDIAHLGPNGEIMAAEAQAVVDRQAVETADIAIIAFAFIAAQQPGTFAADQGFADLRQCLSAQGVAADEICGAGQFDQGGPDGASDRSFEIMVTLATQNRADKGGCD